MTEVYVLATARSPRGKASSSGALSGVTPLSLVEQVMNALVTRAGITPESVDQVILGCASQAGEQGGNIARTAVLDAGWPPSVPGMTVNRFCSSGLDAIAVGAGMIRSGEAEVVLAGGVESVSRVPMFTDGGPLWTDSSVVARIGSVHMGIAADTVATELGYTREELDAYGVRTQQLAAAAWKDGRFDASLVPITDDSGEVALAHDEHVRPGTTAEALAGLPPAFAELGATGQDGLVLRHLRELDMIRHLHTRGTSPSVADGAGLVLIGSAAAARRLGLAPRALLKGSMSAGSDPIRMLLSGQDATVRVLERFGLTPSDVDVMEFAEAFAALCVKIQRELGFAEEVFNPNGGTIAMGHSFGATGAILLTGCVDELDRRQGRYGVVAISGAAGSGTAMLVERVA
ncbi:acetyl-CoA C-acyltransferase [Amycolatopsis sp. NPDC059657]|uniref:acetyl-CoA C-acyltransferase n=1 Tax=Amycolatopsis sp. NPDC059657 TaxID=3346899 RepID=UPI00366CCE8B